MDVWNYLLTHHEAIRNLLLAVAAVIGLPFLLWRTVIARHQTKAALRQAQTSEDNHVSDMFNKAIEQLGKVTENSEPHLELRLGGLYALEKLARNNEDYHPQIMEVLCAYVRMHSPRTIEVIEEVSDDRVELEEVICESHNADRIDVQVAMTIIGRRRTEFDSMKYLNLNNVM